MIVRAWEPGDTERMVFQPSQVGYADRIKGIDLTELAQQGLARTGETAEGVIGIAGLFPQWEGRAIAWVLLSDFSGRHFVQIHREVSRVLRVSPFRRIEATVDVGFTAGHRWMKMLGFEMEGYLKAYRPDGGDQIMYARVRL